MFGCMRSGWGLRRTASAFVLVGVVLGGCASGQPAAAPAGATTAAPATATSAGPTREPDDAPCLNDGEKVVRFPAGDATLPGVVLGTGSVGIVFGHQTDGDLCQWMPAAHTFAAQGYRTLVFDFAGYGRARGTTTPTTTSDVVSASEYLKTLGVTRVALIGASLGGAAVVTAAVHASLPVAAVISLSGSAQLKTDAEPVDAAAKLGAPLLCVAAKADQRGAFATVATGMCPASGPGPRQLLLVDGSDHGVVLYRAHPDVKVAVDGFLNRYAPPSPV
jgi:pimeloyl-ACP methyl ester carboxylesterase